MHLRIVFIVLLLSQVLMAQRPKVGLVLSGGGAKGIAHIGLLEVLDSLGIEVDYVSGTSMGSVMGGLYAVGYSPEAIKKEVFSVDWGMLMSDNIEREYLSYWEKGVPHYLFSTSMKGLKPHVPSGIVSGNNIEAKLHQMFIGFQKDTNFLDLPIGFICVAADLNTAEEVVFTKGSIPKAIRASMSIPSVFDPYDYQGRILIDGGVVNNFPSDKLKDMGCKYIIGVDVQTTKSDTVRKPSITKVLEKTSMFVNYATSDEREALVDVLVKPHMVPYGVTSFEKYLEIYHEGKRAAREAIPELLALKKKLGRSQKKPKKEYVKLDSVHLSEIEVVGLKKVSRESVLGTMDVEEGEKYSIEYLNKHLKYLYGSKNFFKVNYELEKLDSIHHKMKVVLAASPTNTSIGIGLRLDSDFRTQLLINVTNRSLFFEGSRFGLDINIRQNPYFKVFYDYDRGIKPGFGFYSRYYSATPDIYDGSFYQGQVYLHDFSNTLYVQSIIANRARVLFGGQLDLVSYNLSKAPFWETILEDEHLGLSYVNLFARLEFDNLNEVDYPTKGYRISAEGKIHELVEESDDFYTKLDPFLIVKAKYFSAHRLTKRLTALPTVYGGVTFSDEGGAPYNFYIGSLGKEYINNNKSFPGYRFMELRFQEEDSQGGVDTNYSYALNVNTVELTLRYNHYKKHYLMAFGGIGVASQDFKLLYNSHMFGGFGFKYSIQSAIGPLEVAVHKSTERSTVLVYFNLGVWF